MSAPPSSRPRTPAPAPPPVADRITIGWAGDLVPGLDGITPPQPPSRLLKGVAPVTTGFDLMIANLEGALTTRGTAKCTPGQRNCWSFRAPPAYGVEALRSAGIDVVNLANNHALDYGAIGADDTTRALSSAGIDTTGRPGQVRVRDVRGVRVAIVGFAPYPEAAPLNDLPEIERLVARARAAADVVVVVIHAGAEGRHALHVPAGSEWAYGENRGNARGVASVAVSAGADLVVGSGPHVPRGVEFIGRTPIFYSSGNLVGYGGAFATGGVLSMAFVAEVTMTRRGDFVSGRLHDVLIGSDGLPSLDPSGRVTTLVARLSAADFGARAARISPDGAVHRPHSVG